MKTNTNRMCPVCHNQDAATIKFICFERDLKRLHCERCNCAFFHRLLPVKPKYDLEYNKEYNRAGDYFKARVMAQKIIDYARKSFEKPTVFEIGVGNGLTTKYIQDAGIDVKGVDVDPLLCQLLANVLKIKVYAGGLEKLNIVDKFDIVYSSHVIEHFNEPDLFMLKAKTLLNESGFLYLDTPDLNCSEGCKPGWHHFRTRDPWEHCCVLSPQSLMTLANRHSLQVITIELCPQYGSFQAILRKV